MPVLPANAYNSNYKVQQAVNYARVFPDLSPIFPVSGYSQEPSLTIANDMMQRLLAEPLNWKWNRGYVTPFLTVGLQQDYVTQLTDLSWLESCTIVDINNGTNNAFQAPKPTMNLETVRDILPSWRQRTPLQVSFIPNSIAIMGKWKANTKYACGYGQGMTPTSPIQQFIDVNGNILYIDSTVLGLDINSPGFTGTPITLPDNSPYGTSGSTEPAASANSAPGTTVQDGTVVWTVAPPNGYAVRLNPIPPVNGLCWLVQPVYQKKPPIIASLQQTIAPVPDELAFVWREGFIALLHAHAGSKSTAMRYQLFEETLAKARTAFDREGEEFTLYPGSGSFGGGKPSSPAGLGAAYPFLDPLGW